MSVDIDQLFARQVRAMRRLRDMTQSELGELVGLGETQICKIEKGSRAVRVGEAAIIAKALNCPLGDLIASDVAGTYEEQIRKIDAEIGEVCALLSYHQSGKDVLDARRSSVINLIAQLEGVEA